MKTLSGRFLSRCKKEIRGEGLTDKTVSTLMKRVSSTKSKSDGEYRRFLVYLVGLYRGDKKDLKELHSILEELINLDIKR